MQHFRKIAIGEAAENAVTVGIEQNADGKVHAAVWWPAKGDVDGDEVDYDSVKEAFEAAEAARALHGFAEVVVTLQDDVLWRDEWGTIDPATLTDDEAFELARATEAMRDA
ncbi:hypothetical protein [Devosia soli]|nr:hypothetical protein [Devosia soli]